MREPLILPLAAVVSGILLGRWLDFTALGSLLPMVAFLALAIPSTRLRSGCIALALVFLGTFLEAWHRPGAAPEIDAGSKEIVLLDGCVVEPTVFSPGREQFTLELAAGARARVSLPLREEDLDDPDPPRKLSYGQRVEIEARVRSPHNFENPGGFDYAAYLARRKIFWTATMTRGSEARVLPGRCGSRLLAGVFRLRTAALERLDRLYTNDIYSTGMMDAILIGESSGLERVWTENFRRTGTFHALVISGVHVTVLAGVLLFLLRIAAVPELTALAMTAAAAWLYALVSGLSAPVVRAAGGFTLFLIARFLFRRARVLNLLAAVALIYLIWDPWELFDSSFQLSFLAVAAIGALAAPLLEIRIAPLARGMRMLGVEMDPHLAPRVAQTRVELRLAAETFAFWTRLPRQWWETALAWAARLGLFAAEMAVISAVIQIGLALPMAEYFHRVSFTGLTANLLIVPLLNAVVPLGFLAIFTNARWIAALAGWLLHLSARIAEWHAGIEPSWRVPDPPLWLAIAFGASLLLMAWAGAKRKEPPPRNAEERRSSKFVLSALICVYLRPKSLAFTAVLVLFALLLWQPFPSPGQPGSLELTSIDVGQGDSLLLTFPQGRRMLVDGGGVLQFGRARKSNLDIGEDVVSPYLWSLGIRRLDVVVATHAHEDHIGGLPAILENFRPRELWTGANPSVPLLARARQLGVRVVERRAGAPFEFGGAGIEILAPPDDYAAAKTGNNDSLAFRVTYGARSFLLMGDLERPMEARLLGDGLLAHTDVLKVGHHGSKTSSIVPFLDVASPSIAVISAGFENSFGHPHPDVLRRLENRHAAILRTDLDGLVTVSTDGRSLTYSLTAWKPGDYGQGSPFQADLLH